MMFQLNDCVFCKSPDNLNTLTLKFDEGSVAAYVCDNCGEESTIKSTKEAYLKRREEIDKIIEIAKAAGLTISMPTEGSKLASVTSAPEVPSQELLPVPVAPVPKERSEDPTLIAESDELIIGTGKLDTTGLNNPNVRVEGNAPPSGMSAHTVGLRNPSEAEATSLANVTAARAQGQAKIAIVEGREGQAIPIPSVRQDGTGTTRIRIRKSVDDNVLQKRFKNLADSSRGDQGADFRNEYAVRDCPICNGDCEVVDRGQKIMCPKCGGSGVLS